MRRIGVVTVARSDYGIYLPILRAIQADPDLYLTLYVSGMHLSPEFGMTVRQIEKDGFEITERIEMLLSSDTPEGIAKSMGIGVSGYAQVFARNRPDILVVLGDRFEMHAAALAALPFKIPVAHIHGGEITLGAIDDALRHSMSKLSHLHFVSTRDYARRVVQLGEEPWRVTVSGAPSLDNLKDVNLLAQKEIFAKYSLKFADKPFLLVTYHPVTLEHEETEWQISELLAALELSDLPAVFTFPNADTGGRTIIQKIKAFVDANPIAQMVDNLGTQDYFSMMSSAIALIGNSSSGIIEAASFELPVINIGTRQAGRLRGINVIDVDYSREDILVGIENALDPQFVSKLKDMQNPYGSGLASDIIVGELKRIKIDDKLLVKHFYDLVETPEIT